MNDFKVEFFEREDGVFPANDFIESLDSKMKAKFYILVKLLKEYGNTLREPYSKHLEDGIFELRAKQGTDIARVLYFFIIGKKIILTNGFVKKTQKTPRAEINLAKKYKSEYILKKSKEE
ncbi:MAG: type II toxin-antitoxin system RelE/ParE family toxin [Oscillospiraceae bacterium]|nr:type II toxin-antitoxin system RelE/ParE family toxin [Oscillospiraceae bacterium]